MISLLLAVALAQAPTCVSGDAQKVCGYDCKVANGMPRCAQTPQGACAESLGNLVCFDPPAWLARVYGAALPRARCVTRGRQVACGYDCKVDGDALGCARTPAGACRGEYGRVACADPPAALYGVYGRAVPRPTCLATDGHVACGFSCFSAPDEVYCARTPFGRCLQVEGRTTCFDPSGQVLCALGAKTPRAECKESEGHVACGYHCASWAGVVACAQTPQGHCDDSGPGGAACFDPQVEGGDEACLAVLGARERR